MFNHRSTQEVLCFDDTRVTVVGIPLVAFLMPVLFFGVDINEVGFYTYATTWWFVSSMYTLTYWFVMRSLVIWLRRRYPEHQETRKRLLLMFSIILPLFVLVHVLLDYLCQAMEQKNANDQEAMAASLVMVLFIISIYEGVYFYYRWKQSLVEAERLRHQHVQSQLEGLKNQVNPHFLFNSLNTLTYLIPEDSERAVHFVQKLAKVYRYILEIHECRLIPLSEELEFIQAYLVLLKERFGENLQIDIQVSELLYSRHIIPLSLQILIENVIKHNIISRDFPLVIEIFVDEREGLIVRNHLRPKNQQQNSTQVGLANISNRYAFFTDEKVGISQDDTYFAVRLPLLHAPVNQLVSETA